MTQVTGIEITVEGRTFVQESPTFEQEMYILQQVTEAGFDRIPNDVMLAVNPENPDDADLDPLVKQMIIRAYASGTLFRLMAALVVEKGTEWSPERAAEIADLFRKTRDPAAKKQLQPALVGAVLGFFESGVSSGRTSLISSASDAISLEPKPNSPRGPKPKLTAAEAEEVFRTGSTKSLSGKSPSITGSIRKSSSGGKSAKG